MKFIPHDLSAHKFNEWVKTLDDDECTLLLTFITYCVLAENFPSVSIPQLRGFIKTTYTSRPNKTWGGFLEYIKEEDD